MQKNENGKRYFAFISYRHRTPDTEIAMRLHTLIETYKIPGAVRKKTGRRKTGRVFRDQDELPLSSDLGRDIQDALDQSEWLICICTPEYQKSKWCMRELEYFSEKYGKDRVLTLLASGDPEESFPPPLRYRIEADGTITDVEPLAGNVAGPTLRESLKKLNGEKLRLLAPMLGVTYDELKEREKQRRRKRRLTTAVAAAVLACVLGGFLIRNAALKKEAAEQQRIAEEQRLRAEEEAERAEQQRLRAEEEARKAKEERLNAVMSSLDKSLQTAFSLLNQQDRQRAAATLLDALALSDENGGMRREEILGELRKTLYFAPFEPISRLDMQNLTLNNAQVSPDGTNVLCIANSNAAALINLDDSTIRYAVSKNNETLYPLAFSPDGARFLGVWGNYRAVTVWNTEDGSEVYTYMSQSGDANKIGSALFFKTSDQLLVQDEDQLILINLTDGAQQVFYTLGEQQEGYNPDSTLYTMRTGKAIKDGLSTDGSYVLSSLLLSEDGQRLLFSGADGSTGTIILDDEGRRVSLLDRLPGIGVDLYALSPDGKYAACKSAAMGFLGVWDTENGRMRYLHPLNIDIANQDAFSSAPVFSPDSSSLAYVVNGELVIEAMPNGKEIARLTLEETEFPPRISWSADGKLLFFTNPNLYAVDGKTGQTVFLVQSNIDYPYNNAVPVSDRMVFVSRGGGESGCYSLEGLSSIVTADTFDQSLVGYDPRAGREEVWTDPPAGEHHVSETYQILLGMKDEPDTVCYSPDSRYAALAYPDGVIEVYRKEDGDKVYLYNNQFAAGATACGIAEDVLCAADDKGRIMFQDLTDGSITILETDGGHAAFVFDLRSGLLMAAQSDGMKIDVLSWRDKELLFTLSSAAPFTRMGFSEDGAYAVAFTDEGCMTAKLYPDEESLLQAARELAPGH